MAQGENSASQLVVGQSGRLCCGYVYADAGEGESTTDVVFTGHNMIAENGQVAAGVAGEAKLRQGQDLDPLLLRFPHHGEDLLR